jgi:hypothetical protein
MMLLQIQVHQDITRELEKGQQEIKKDIKGGLVEAGGLEPPTNN